MPAGEAEKQTGETIPAETLHTALDETLEGKDLKCISIVGSLVLWPLFGVARRAVMPKRQTPQ